MSKAWDILAYAYDADTHCPDCAAEAGMTSEDATDSEGNGVGVIFASDASNYDDRGLYCGDCGDEIIPRDLTPIIEEAKERGKRAGRNAGSWVVDGNTTDETKEAIRKGISAGDPEIMDMMPSWLSGEWAGESISELLGDLLEDAGENAEEDILEAYEEAATQAYWDEVEDSVSR